MGSRMVAVVPVVLALVVGLLGPVPAPSAAQEGQADSPTPTAEIAAADGARQVRQRDAIEIVRYAGQVRTETAASIASDRSAAGPDFGDHTVLLARMDAFPDSLAGGYLAGAQRAPILLTASDTLSPRVAAYLETAEPDNVIILGGTQAVSSGVEQQLASDHRVRRVGGAGRVETAAEIARYAGPDQSEGLALLATAGEFPDALTASAVAAGEGAPLLLTGRDELPQATADALDDLAIDEVIIAGGTAAVADDVRADLERRGIRVQRAAGGDRFATARAVGTFAQDRFGWADDHLNLASGTGFADAVAMAPHAGLEAGGPAPIALAAAEQLPPATAAWMADVAACDVGRLHIAGGTAAVSESVAEQAVAALTPAGGCADDDPPTVAFDDPDAGATVQLGSAGVTVAGTAVDDETAVRSVELYAGDQRLEGTVGRGGDVAWEFDVMLPPGDHTLRAVATDGSGQTGEATREITVEDWAPGDTVVRDDVVVLDDDLAGGLVDVDDDGLSFDRPAGEVGLSPGDVLVGGVTPQTPEGLLRTVVVVVHDGDGGTTVITDGARLTDVFWHVDVSWNTPLTLDGATDHTIDSVDVHEEDPPELIEPTPEYDVTEGPRSDFRPSTLGAAGTAALPGPDSAPSDGAVGEAEAVVAALSVGDEWSLDYDETFGTDDAAIDVNGSLTFGFELGADLSVDTRWEGWLPEVYLEKFEVLLEVTEAARAAVEARGQGSVADELDLGSIDLPTIEFTVGPIPVVITSDIGFTLHAEASFEASGSAGASQEFTFRIGIRYTDANGWQPINEQDNDFDIEPIEFSAEAAAEAGVDARLTSKLYGLAGPFFALGPYTGVTLEADPDLMWELYFGLRSSAGLEVDFPVVGRFGEEFELFDLTQTIGTGQPEPYPEPAAVTIASPEVTTVGCCDVLLDAAVANPRSDDEQWVHWESDRDGDLGAAYESDPHRATLSPGTHQLTATVEETVDGDEHEWSESVQVTVVDRFDGDNEQLRVGPWDGGQQLLFTLGMDDQADLVAAQRFAARPDLRVSSGVVRDAPLMGGAGVLTTGDRADVATRNDGEDQTGTDLGTSAHLGDSDHDATVLELDLDVPDWGNCVRFDFRFATEELPYYVGSEYNDAFLAELTERGAPSSWSVTGSEVEGDSFARAPDDLPVWVNNLASYWVRPPAALDTPFNEATPVMRAATPVAEGEHTLRLGIFDQGDATRDSAVFINNLEIVDTAGDCTSGLAPGGLGLTPTRN